MQSEGQSDRRPGEEVGRSQMVQRSVGHGQTLDLTPKMQREGLGGLAQGRDRIRLTFAEDHSAFRVGNRE